MALWWLREVLKQTNLTELYKQQLLEKRGGSYFAEEPVALEWPEDRVYVEHEGVRMWGVVTCEEAHFN